MLIASTTVCNLSTPKSGESSISASGYFAAYALRSSIVITEYAALSSPMASALSSTDLKISVKSESAASPSGETNSKRVMRELSIFPPCSFRAASNKSDCFCGDIFSNEDTPFSSSDFADSFSCATVWGATDTSERLVASMYTSVNSGAAQLLP